MSSPRLVLLPGLDGTGILFDDFVTALPSSLTTTVVAYPQERFLPHAELVRMVAAAVPEEESFVLLAESFSSPLAFKFAAAAPPNLAAIVICAGFVREPLGRWSHVAKAIVGPWLFALGQPQWALEHFLLGEGASVDLIERLRRTISAISPATLTGRIRESLGCDVRAELARTNVPIMYVRALRDRLLSASCHEEILRMKPEAELATVDAPHLLLQRQPHQAAKIISAFVAKA